MLSDCLCDSTFVFNMHPLYISKMKYETETEILTIPKV